MALKKKLRTYLEDDAAPQKRRLDVLLAFLIVTSIASYVIYLSDAVPPSLHHLFHAFDFAVIAIFAIEYLARLHVASDFIGDLREGGLRQAIGRKIDFMLRPMSVIDLVALLPALRVFRLARIFRLVRVLRIVRNQSAFAGMLQIFREHAFELGTVFVFMMAVLIFAGVAMFLVENPADMRDRGITPQFEHIGDAFWWAAVSMTTVGYGDKVPQTGVGRIIAGFVILSGVLVIAFPTAIITSAFTEKLARMKEGTLKMASFTEHVVICGLTKSTPLIEREIEKWSALTVGRVLDVVVISSFAVPGTAAPGKALLKIGDITRESVLLDAGVASASTIIILAERRSLDTPDETVDARTVVAAMQARSINKTALLVVEIVDPESVKTLKAHVPEVEVVESGALGPRLMAVGTFHRGTTSVIAELLTPGGNDLYEIELTEAHIAQFPNFGPLFPLLRSQNATPVGLRRGREVFTNPHDSFALLAEDVVITIAETQPVL
jgi:voltage-gated potassium channel